MSNLYKELSRILDQGSAHHGRQHWMMQRFTAVALAILGLWFMLESLTFSSFTYNDMRGWIQSPWHLAGMFMLLTAAFYHAYLGLCVIIEDYTKRFRLLWLLCLALLCGLGYALGVTFLIKLQGA